MRVQDQFVVHIVDAVVGSLELADARQHDVDSDLHGPSGNALETLDDGVEPSAAHLRIDSENAGLELHVGVDVEKDPGREAGIASRCPEVRLASGRVEATLLSWYAENGRDLPWRRTRDPYSILVSEVMLQQTQVERVIPRYLEWLERWPTVEALAAAPRAEVIRRWQGLGYNRRAVNLHAAAQRIAEFGWPADLTELPGVGRYTADAVARFAFDHQVLPVDTNVRRVQERTGAAFGSAAAQALMDLGATVCLARIPRCGVCPLALLCPSHGRRYEPARRQSRFEGSFRQRRTETLRLVARRPQRLEQLDAASVEALARDGLVSVADGRVTLPN